MSSTRRRVPTAALIGAGLLLALILAGVVSFYADSDPDGLSRVAEDKGFSSSETEHDTADGTFAGYATRGVDDARLSGGLAGVVGCAVVLVIAGGVAYGVRRRGAHDVEQADDDTSTTSV